MAGALATGVFAALFVLLAQRHLGLENFVPLAQLWTIWGVAAASLTFAFQQWVVLRDDGRPLFRLLTRSEYVLVGSASLALFVGTFSFRDDLFRSPSLLWPLLAALVPIGTAGVGTARGLLALRSTPQMLAVAIAGENAIRLVLGLILVLLGSAVTSFGIAVVAPFAAIPLVVGRTGKLPSKTTADGRGRSTSKSQLGTSALSGLLAYVLFNGTPVVYALRGAPAEDVSALFLLLTAVRVPYLILQGLIPVFAVSLLDDDRTLGTVVQRLAWRGVVLGICAGGVAALLGEITVGQAFALGDRVGAVAYGATGTAAVVAVTSLLITVAATSAGHEGRLLQAWALPVAVTYAWLAATSTPSIDAIAIALLASSALVLTLLVVGSKIYEPNEHAR